jgi:hypothetical protein
MEDGILSDIEPTRKAMDEEREGKSAKHFHI